VNLTVGRIVTVEWFLTSDYRQRQKTTIWFDQLHGLFTRQWHYIASSNLPQTQTCRVTHLICGLRDFSYGIGIYRVGQKNCTQFSLQ